MGTHGIGHEEHVQGASGRRYAIQYRQDCWGASHWFVGTDVGWGAPFLSEPQAREWARTH